VDGAYFQSYCSFQLFHHFFYGVSYVVVGRAIRAATLLMSMALAFLFSNMRGMVGQKASDASPFIKAAALFFISF